MWPWGRRGRSAGVLAPGEEERRGSSRGLARPHILLFRLGVSGEVTLDCVDFKLCKSSEMKVAEGGLEPPLPEGKWILNPSRLPIPPLRHTSH